MLFIKESFSFSFIPRARSRSLAPETAKAACRTPEDFSSVSWGSAVRHVTSCEWLERAELVAVYCMTIFLPVSPGATAAAVVGLFGRIWKSFPPPFLVYASFSHKEILFRIELNISVQ